MKADDQHMDDIFRKAAEEQYFPYRSDFWNDMETQLGDDSLDSAFKTASENFMVTPNLDLAAAIDDAFLDDAFRSAAENTAVEYPANAWNGFLNEAAAIEQDIAFTAAANSVTADYHPVFWTDADQALQNEGLHYEYNASYWNDAKNLLDHADRKVFFYRWSAVAAVLLLLSFGGIYQSFNADQNPAPLASERSTVQVKQSNIFAENDVTAATSFSADAATHNALYTEDVTVLQPAENNTITVQHNETVVNPQNSDLSISSSEYTPENNESVTETQISNTGINNTLITNPEITAIIANENPAQLNLPETAVNPSEVVSQTNTVAQLSETDLNTDLSALPVNDISRLNQTLITAYAGPQIKIERSKLSPTHTLSFVGNAGIGNKYGESDFTPSFRTSFGLEYKRTGFGILRHFELGGSASMNHVRQNNFGTERRVDRFNINGGVDKYWYKLQFKDMIYANMSGLVSYRLSKRSNVRLSVGIDYLVFVQSNMSYKVNADQGVTTVNNNWGVKDGLTKVDARFGLGYEFAVTSRFAVQLNGSFGCLDRSDDSFISKNFFDHEMNATVGLKYTFLRKL